MKHAFRNALIPLITVVAMTRRSTRPFAHEAFCRFRRSIANVLPHTAERFELGASASAVPWNERPFGELVHKRRARDRWEAGEFADDSRGSREVFRKGSEGVATTRLLPGTLSGV